jgi:regulator of replication initiation timing
LGVAEARVGSIPTVNSQWEKIYRKKRFAMELNNDISQIDMDDIVNDLLDQNGRLRLEIASLKAALKLEAREAQLVSSMKQSQNIPPEALEMLSKLDIR